MANVLAVIPVFGGNIVVADGAAEYMVYGKHAGFVDLTVPLAIAEHGDWVAVAHNAVREFRISMTQLAAIALAVATHMEMADE